jgi:pyridoxamine 5'-phosphate oxidase
VGFDADAVPATPQELFLQWFRTAEDAGIPEPHALRLTADPELVPEEWMVWKLERTEVELPG